MKQKMLYIIFLASENETPLYKKMFLFLKKEKEFETYLIYV